MGTAETVTSILGSRPVSAVWNRLRAGLRILAFHDVPDGDAFAAQLDLIGRRHVFVSGAQVARARSNGSLPKNAVWVTFDDGDASVFRTAAPILADRSIPATAYVCPGLLDPPTPPWWEQIEAAGRRGTGAEVAGRHLRGSDLVRAAKTVPDAERRRILDGLRPIPEPLERPASAEELDAWVAAGFQVGNHTWDHPCLDRCTAEEQTEQIVRAHDWLTDRFGASPTTFAYPNGDCTDHALGVLRDLGYETVLRFDHRIARTDPRTPELSRLRIDAGIGARRTRAIVSGAHSDVMGLRDGR